MLNIVLMYILQGFSRVQYEREVFQNDKIMQLCIHFGLQILLSGYVVQQAGGKWLVMQIGRITPNIITHILHTIQSK